MKLFLIKLLHTAIWVFMASCVFLVLAAGVFGFENFYVYLAIGVILFEGLVLLIFKWKCPLTLIAKKYTQDKQENFDIFLPRLLAKHNKTIFTTLFLTGLALIILRKNI